MARRPDLERFAVAHGLKIGTIADLIHYRVSHEKTVKRECDCALPTEFGTFRILAYRDSIDNDLHLALVRGDISPERPVLVRVHIQNSLCDLFGTQHPGCGWPLREVMRQVAKEGEGVIVVLRNRDRVEDLLGRFKTLEPDREGAEGMSQPRKDHSELRNYGIGAQILADIGVRKMRVMSAPRAMHGISGFELEVVEYVGGDSV